MPVTICILLHIYQCLIVVVGVAVLDVFNVRCMGWINCLGVENDQLTYNHYVAHRNRTAGLPVYSGHNLTASLLFPVGDAGDDFRNILIIYVSNYANYTSEPITYPVTVSSLLTVHSWAD